MGGTSRMSREAQVRICERLGAKLPGPTRRQCWASNPLRNSRPEWIADDGKDVLLLSRPIAWRGLRRTQEAAARPGLPAVTTHRTDPFRMPLKTPFEGALFCFDTRAGIIPGNDNNR